MKLYGTKLTFDRYPKIKEIVRNENDINEDDLIDSWAMKIFYFDGKKCLQVVHFPTKFSLVFVNVKVTDLKNLDNMIKMEVLHFYSGDIEMEQALAKLFMGSSETQYYYLKDKSMISTLNRTQSDFLFDGYSLNDYIENNILYTRDVINDLNREWIMTIKKNGKSEYIFTGEEFRSYILHYFSDENISTYIS